MSDNLLAEFFVECREHLEGIESDLLAVEQAGDNADPELVNKVFRAAHSIKGGSAFFNLENIKTLAHRIETVLDMVRSHKISINPETINILLNSFDTLRNMINNPDELEKIDISSHVEALEALVTQMQTGAAKKNFHGKTEITSPDAHHSITIPEIDLQTACENNQYIYLIEYDLLHDFDRQGKSSLNLLKSLSQMGVIIDTVFDIKSMGTLDDEPVKNMIVKFIYRTVLEPNIVESAVEASSSEKIHILHTPKGCRKVEKIKPEENPSTVVQTQETPKIEELKMSPSISKQIEPENSKTQEDTPKSASVVPETVRINVSLLDILMSEAGELVLSRNQLVDAITRSDKKAISTSAQRLSFVISELQEAVMQTRLQPISNVFNKFSRMVRDMSQTLHKELRLVTEGKDVELDKTIIEGLSDPLTHMVRNAADHGVESPQERARLNKPPVGTISLRAYHEAGHVVIEIEDDGKGIDPQKIAAKALSMGMVTEEKLRGMADNDKTALIFLPGLSTAEKVSETSGRGVGMDVVKNNLDRLGGKVSINSVLGKGTKFHIKLPLTLAIIPSLIVHEEGERFAIPQVNVVELLNIPAAEVKKRIQVVGNADVVVLRGELIPLVSLSSVLGTPKTYIDPVTGKRELDRRAKIADRRSRKRTIEGKNVDTDQSFEQKRTGQDRRKNYQSNLGIVIISSGILQYGLLVDKMQDTEEIVVKPLGAHLKGLHEYAGATIMGDGEVALILDVTGIALKSGISSVSAANEKKTRSEDERIEEDSSHSLLLFNNDKAIKCGMPLDLVKRVERIKKEQIERMGGIRTMQYRGSSLPVVQLSDVAEVDEVPPDGDLAVIVSTIGGHDVGLLGMMPVSVIESEFTVDTETHRQPGISGSAILDNNTVLMLDVFEIIDKTHPDWKKNLEKHKENNNDTTILLAEDSNFFRNQVCKYLEDGGFNIISASDGLEAWEMLQNNKVNIVVTDIEMPRMNGFELCKKIRDDQRFAGMPVIALTSLAGEEDQRKGMEAGISDYQVKLDRDRLLEGINSLLHN